MTHREIRLRKWKTIWWVYLRILTLWRVTHLLFGNSGYNKLTFGSILIHTDHLRLVSAHFLWCLPLLNVNCTVEMRSTHLIADTSTEALCEWIITRFVTHVNIKYEVVNSLEWSRKKLNFATLLSFQKQFADLLTKLQEKVQEVRNHKCIS